MSAALPSGFPALANTALGLTGSAGVVAVADAIGLNSEQVLGGWTIAYTSAAGTTTLLGAAASILTFDTVVSLSFEGDYDVLDYPIEQGQFESYNKVWQPYTVKMTVALSGAMNVLNIAESAVLGGVTSLSSALGALNGTTMRSQFLNQLDQVRASLTPIAITTPDANYPSVTIKHVGYDRAAAKGAKLLQVDIWFEQINVSASSTYSNVASSSAADPVNTGTVQAGTSAAPVITAVTQTPLG